MLNKVALSLINSYIIGMREAQRHSKTITKADKMVTMKKIRTDKLLIASNDHLEMVSHYSRKQDEAYANCDYVRADKYQVLKDFAYNNSEKGMDEHSKQNPIELSSYGLEDYEA